MRRSEQSAHIAARHKGLEVAIRLLLRPFTAACKQHNSQAKVKIRTLIADHHGVDHVGHIAGRRRVVLAQDERLETGGAGALRLHDGHHREEEAHLGVEHRDVLAAGGWVRALGVCKKKAHRKNLATKVP